MAGPSILLLWRIEKTKLKTRDILIMWMLRNMPGLSNSDVTEKLGKPFVSMVQFNIDRLIRNGLIEDRRKKPGKTVATILHLTPKGLSTLKELVGEDG